MSKRILISGATGQQGGSVINALLGSGHQITGVTRNVESPKAKALEERGVQVISVDFNNFDALVEAMKDIDVVFSMTTPFEAGVEAETKQGITVANAAEAAGVGHFIFNSVGDAERNTGIPHFDSKYEVEKHLSTLNLNWTIIGPAYFMENLAYFGMEGLKNGVLSLAMPGDIKLQQISVVDIGRVVARVVNEGASMYGQRINIAGDEISGEAAAEVLSRVIGRPISYHGFSPDAMREQSEDMALMYEWFIEEGYTADMNLMREWGLEDFEAWAKRQDWSEI